MQAAKETSLLLNLGEQVACALPCALCGMASQGDAVCVWVRIISEHRAGIVLAGPSLWADWLTTVASVLRSYQQFFFHSQSPVIGCWNTLGYFQILFFFFFYICLGGLWSSLRVCLSFNERLNAPNRTKPLGLYLLKYSVLPIQLPHHWVGFVRFGNLGVPLPEPSEMCGCTSVSMLVPSVPGKQSSAQMSSAG